MRIRSFLSAAAALATVGALTVGVTAVRTPTPAGAAPTAAAQPGGYTALAPVRLLDTRRGPGPLAAHGTLTLPVAGRGGVPATGASAVLLDVTATRPAADGFLTVYPRGVTRPDAVSLSVTRGVTVQSLTAVPLGAGGAVRIYNGAAGTVHVLAEVVGYYRGGGGTTAGAFAPLTLARVLSTRTGIGVPARPVAGHRTLAVRVTGRGGVPGSGVAAVVLTVTVTNPAAGGFLTAFAHGSTRPDTAELSFPAGGTVSNLVVVRVGEGGQIDLYNGSAGSVNLIADVAGYVRAGGPVLAGTLATRNHLRILDTRTGNGTGQQSPVPAHGTVTVRIDDLSTVPAPAGTVAVLTVTALRPAAAGYVIAGPHGTALPAAANLSFPAGRTVADLVAVPVGADSSIDLRNGSAAPVDLVADLAGLVTDGSLGAVTGRVTDAAGHPLSRVGVAAAPGGGQTGGETVTTGSDGDYALGGLAPTDQESVCFGAARARGGSSVTGNLDQCFDRADIDNAYSGSPTGVVVQAGQVTTDIDGRINPAGAITGRVTDTAGRPLGGVAVNASGANSRVDTVTAADGTYRIIGLMSDRYSMCFAEAPGKPVTGGTSRTGYVTRCNGDGTLEQPEVRAGQTVTGYDVQLVTGAAVTGTVTDTAGHPLRGAAVAVAPAGDQMYFPTAPRTGSSGTYRLAGLAAGTYRICVRGATATGGSSTTGYLSMCYDNVPYVQPPTTQGPAGTDIPLTVGQLRTGVNLRLPAAGAIAGTVTGPSGGPMPGVMVRVLTDRAFVDSATTGADGTYLVRSLAADTYLVCFYASLSPAVPPPSGVLNQCYQGVDPVRATPDVVVTAGHLTSRIDARMNAGGRISGRVTGPSGEPLGNVAVTVDLGNAGDRGVVTAADGSYLVRWVQPGVHHVCFGAAGATGGAGLGYNDACYRDVPPDGTPTDVPVTVGSTTTGIDAHLTLAGAITGTVTDPEGHPLAGVDVAYYVGDQRGNGTGLGPTGDDGVFSINRLPGGLYTLCFQASAHPVTGGSSQGGYADGCYGRTDTREWTPVTVTDGATTTVTMRLDELSAVSGRVTDTAGNPLQNVFVYVLDGGTSYPTVWTGADGGYRVDRLHPGTYTVCFDGFWVSPGGYGRQCWDHVDGPGAPTPIVLAAGQLRSGIDGVLVANPTVAAGATVPRAVPPRPAGPARGSARAAP